MNPHRPLALSARAARDAIACRVYAIFRLMAVLCCFGAMATVATIAHADDGFLDPSVAFRFSATETTGAVHLDYRIADGYYMYRERFAFNVIGQSAVQLGTPQIPQGHVKFDATFNKNVETYRGGVSIVLPVTKANGPFDLQVTSQGCSDKGVCYPPAQHTVHVSGLALQPVGSVSAAAPPGGNALSDAPDTASADGRSGGDNNASPTVADRLYSQGYASSVLANRSLPAVLGIFFLLGVALSLLPCSLPMIPILSSIILGEGVALTRRRGFALSLSYVLGMAIVYTAFGVAAALAGQGLGQWLQNPWVLGAFALLLMVFALSLFGCYELQLPTSWQNQVSGASQRLSGGKTAAVFIMGALSALVVGACMTAPLFGVLAFIAQTGNVVLGGASLFVMALGIGVPLLVVGIGAGSILPRAGAWMDGVKRAFGVILSGAAVWIVAPVLPAGFNLVLWAVVALLAAFALQTFDAQPGSAWRWIGRAIGATAAIYAVALLVGAAGGSRDPLMPLAVYAPQAWPRATMASNQVGGGAALSGTAGTPGTASAQTTSGGEAATRALSAARPGALPGALLFAPVRSLDQLARATATAGRPSMLFFHADWCTSCLEMERSVFPAPAVSAQLDHFALLQADVTSDNTDDQALMAHFRMFGPPAVMFFDAKGREIVSMRVMGYQPADRFAQTLTRALSMANATVPAGDGVADAAGAGAGTGAASAPEAPTSPADKAHVAALLGQAIAAQQGRGGRQGVAGEY